MSFYDTSLQQLLDFVAPLKSQTVLFHRSAPWFTTELRQLKSTGTHLERLYKRTGLTVHREMFKEHIVLYENALADAKSKCHSQLIPIMAITKLCSPQLIIC